MDTHYFYSLIHVHQKKKSRTCLKCKTSFISHHAGHRICGACRTLISKQGPLADQVPLMSQATELEELSRTS